MPHSAKARETQQRDARADTRRAVSVRHVTRKAVGSFWDQNKVRRETGKE